MPAAHSTDRLWVVYFIQMGDDGPIKIGLTNRSVKQRVADLQTGSPWPLHILAILPVKSPLDEYAIHRHFRDLRMCGEWFLPEFELFRFIRRIYREGKEAILGIEALDPSEDVPPPYRRFLSSPDEPIED